MEEQVNPIDGILKSIGNISGKQFTEEEIQQMKAHYGDNPESALNSLYNVTKKYKNKDFSFKEKVELKRGYGVPLSFKETLALGESRGTGLDFDTTNSESTAYGPFQITEANHKKRIQSLYGADWGTFQKDPKLQEKYMDVIEEDYNKKVPSYKEYPIAKQRNLTDEQVKAAIHVLGASGAKTYLQTGEVYAETPKESQRRKDNVEQILNYFVEERTNYGAPAGVASQYNSSGGTQPQPQNTGDPNIDFSTLTQANELLKKNTAKLKGMPKMGKEATVQVPTSSGHSSLLRTEELFKPVKDKKAELDGNMLTQAADYLSDVGSAIVGLPKYGTLGRGYSASLRERERQKKLEYEKLDKDKNELYKSVPAEGIPAVSIEDAVELELMSAKINPYIPGVPTVSFPSSEEAHRKGTLRIKEHTSLLQGLVAARKGSLSKEEISIVDNMQSLDPEFLASYKMSDNMKSYVLAQDNLNTQLAINGETFSKFTPLVEESYKAILNARQNDTNPKDAFNEVIKKYTSENPADAAAISSIKEKIGFTLGVAEPSIGIPVAEQVQETAYGLGKTAGALFDFTTDYFGSLKRVFSNDAKFDKELLKDLNNEETISKIKDIVINNPNDASTSDLVEELVKVGDRTLVLKNGKVDKIRDKEGKQVYYITKQDEQAVEQFGKNPEKYTKEKSVNFEAGWQQGLQILTDMAPMIAASAATGGGAAGMILGSATVSFGDYYEQALAESGDISKSGLYAAMTSGTIGYVESRWGKAEALFGRSFTGAEKSAIIRSIEETTKKAASKGVLASRLERGHMQMIKDAVVSSSPVLKEVPMEVIGELTNFPVEGTTAALFEMPYEAPSSSELINIGGLTILTTTALGVLGGVAGANKENMNSLISLGVANRDGFQEVADNWVQSARDKGLSEDEVNRRQAEVDKKLKLIDTVGKYYDYIKEESEEVNLSSEKKNAIMDLAQQKAMLDYKAEGSTSSIRRDKIAAEAAEVQKNLDKLVYSGTDIAEPITDSDEDIKQREQATEQKKKDKEEKKAAAEAEVITPEVVPPTIETVVQTDGTTTPTTETLRTEPKAEQVADEVVSDNDYNTFVNDNIVSPTIIETIAQKVKQNETLSLREQAILAEKGKDVESVLQATQTTEQGVPTPTTEKVAPTPQASSQTVNVEPITKKDLKSLTQERQNEIYEALPQDAKDNHFRYGVSGVNSKTPAKFYTALKNAVGEEAAAKLIRGESQPAVQETEPSTKREQTPTSEQVFTYPNGKTTPAVKKDGKWFLPETGTKNEDGTYQGAFANDAQVKQLNEKVGSVDVVGDKAAAQPKIQTKTQPTQQETEVVEKESSSNIYKSLIKILEAFKGSVTISDIKINENSISMSLLSKGKRVGLLSLTVVDGKVRIGVVNIFPEFQKQGIAENLYTELDKLLQEGGLGELHSDFYFLDDSTTKRWVLDGKTLTKEEAKDILSDIDKAQELFDSERLVRTDAEQPAIKLWEKLIRKGKAEKLDDGTYKFKKLPIAPPAAEVNKATPKTSKTDSEIKRVQDEIDYTESQIENLQQEIKNEKENLKDDIKAIRDKIAEVRKSPMSKAAKEDRLEELKAEIEDLQDNYEGIVENYKNDIENERVDLKKLKKELAKLQAKKQTEVEVEPTPAATKTETPPKDKATEKEVETLLEPIGETPQEREDQIFKFFALAAAGGDKTKAREIARVTNNLWENVAKQLGKRSKQAAEAWIQAKVALIGKTSVAGATGMGNAKFQLVQKILNSSEDASQDTARRLLSEGKNRDDVFALTGWYQNDKGELLYEIDDVKLKGSFDELFNGFDGLQDGSEKELNIENVIEGTILERYPELKEYKVTLIKDGSKEEGQKEVAFVDYDAKTIGINYYGARNFVGNRDGNKDSFTKTKESQLLASVIAHELQHATQFFDGRNSDADLESGLEAIKAEAESDLRANGKLKGLNKEQANLAITDWVRRRYADESTAAIIGYRRSTAETEARVVQARSIEKVIGITDEYIKERENAYSEVIDSLIKKGDKTAADLILQEAKKDSLVTTKTISKLEDKVSKSNTKFQADNANLSVQEAIDKINNNLIPEIDRLIKEMSNKDNIKKRGWATAQAAEHIRELRAVKAQVEKNMKDPKFQINEADLEKLSPIEKLAVSIGLDIDDLGFLGKGDFGTAYSTSDGRVIKQTSSKTEAQIAAHRMNNNDPNFVKIYDVKETKNGSYLILQEEADSDSSIEDDFYAVQNLLDEVGYDLSQVGNLDKDELSEDSQQEYDRLNDFINQLGDIYYSHNKIGIFAPDIKPDNLGYTSKGKLIAFDIEDKASKDRSDLINNKEFSNTVNIDSKTIKLQQDAAKFRAATIELANNQVILAALDSPNESSFVHEMAHSFESDLLPEEKQTFIDEYNELFGEKEKGWSTDVSEYFARVWEKYLSNGRKLTSAEVKNKERRETLQEVFDKFTDWLQGIYNGVIEYNNSKGVKKEITVSPATQAIFDNINNIKTQTKDENKESSQSNGQGQRQDEKRGKSQENEVRGQSEKGNVTTNQQTNTSNESKSNESNQDNQGQERQGEGQVGTALAEEQGKGKGEEVVDEIIEGATRLSPKYQRYIARALATPSISQEFKDALLDNAPLKNPVTDVQVEAFAKAVVDQLETLDDYVKAAGELVQQFAQTISRVDTDPTVLNRGAWEITALKMIEKRVADNYGSTEAAKLHQRIANVGSVLGQSLRQYGINSPAVMYVQTFGRHSVTEAPVYDADTFEGSGVTHRDVANSLLDLYESAMQEEKDNLKAKIAAEIKAQSQKDKAKDTSTKTDTEPNLDAKKSKTDLVQRLSDKADFYLERFNSRSTGFSSGFDIEAIIDYTLYAYYKTAGSVVKTKRILEKKFGKDAVDTNWNTVSNSESFNKATLDIAQEKLLTAIGNAGQANEFTGTETSNRTPAQMIIQSITRQLQKKDRGPVSKKTIEEVITQKSMDIDTVSNLRRDINGGLLNVEADKRAEVLAQVDDLLAVLVKGQLDTIATPWVKKTLIRQKIKESADNLGITVDQLIDDIANRAIITTSISEEFLSRTGMSVEDAAPYIKIIEDSIDSEINQKVQAKAEKIIVDSYGKNIIKLEEVVKTLEGAFKFNQDNLTAKKAELSDAVRNKTKSIEELREMQKAVKDLQEKTSESRKKLQTYKTRLASGQKELKRKVSSKTFQRMPTVERVGFLVRNGGLSDETVFQAFAEVLGARNFTQADAETLRSLYERLDTSMFQIDKKEAAEAIAKFAFEIKSDVDKQIFIDILDSYAYSNMLGSLKTADVAISSGYLTFLYQEILSAGAQITKDVHSLVTGKSSEFQNMKLMLDSFANMGNTQLSWAQFKKVALGKDGISLPEINMQGDKSKQSGARLEANMAYLDKVRALRDRAKANGENTKAFGYNALIAHSIVSRMLIVADYVTTSTLLPYKVHRNLTDSSIKELTVEGLVHPSYSEVRERVKSKMKLDEVEAQLQSVGLTPKVMKDGKLVNSSAYSKRKAQILYEFIEESDKLALVQAEDSMRRIAFTGRISGMSGAAVESLNRIFNGLSSLGENKETGKKNLGAMILTSLVKLGTTPFAGVIFRVAQFVKNSTPFGVLQLKDKASRQSSLIPIKFFEEYNYYNVYNGQVEKVPATQFEKEARWLMAMTPTIVAMGMFASMFDYDDEEDKVTLAEDTEWFFTTGYSPAMARKLGLTESTYEPYTAYKRNEDGIFERKFSYKDMPFLWPLAAVGRLQEKLIFDQEETTPTGQTPEEKPKDPLKSTDAYFAAIRSVLAFSTQGSISSAGGVVTAGTGLIEGGNPDPFVLKKTAQGLLRQFIPFSALQAEADNYDSLLSQAARRKGITAAGDVVDKMIMSKPFMDNYEFDILGENVVQRPYGPLVTTLTTMAVEGLGHAMKGDAELKYPNARKVLTRFMDIDKIKKLYFGNIGPESYKATTVWSPDDAQIHHDLSRDAADLKGQTIEKDYESLMKLPKMEFEKKLKKINDDANESVKIRYAIDKLSYMYKEGVLSERIKSIKELNEFMVEQSIYIDPEGNIKDFNYLENYEK